MSGTWIGFCWESESVHWKQYFLAFCHLTAPISWPAMKHEDQKKKKYSLQQVCQK